VVIIPAHGFSFHKEHYKLCKKEKAENVNADNVCTKNSIKDLRFTSNNT
jgi:hypothetical protein